MWIITSSAFNKGELSTSEFKSISKFGKDKFMNIENTSTLTDWSKIDFPNLQKNSFESILLQIELYDHRNESSKIERENVNSLFIGLI